MRELARRRLLYFPLLHDNHVDLLWQDVWYLPNTDTSSIHCVQRHQPVLLSLGSEGLLRADQHTSQLHDGQLWGVLQCLTSSNNTRTLDTFTNSPTNSHPAT